MDTHDRIGVWETQAINSLACLHTTYRRFGREGTDISIPDTTAESDDDGVPGFSSAELFAAARAYVDRQGWPLDPKLEQLWEGCV